MLQFTYYFNNLLNRCKISQQLSCANELISLYFEAASIFLYAIEAESKWHRYQRV